MKNKLTAEQASIKYSNNLKKLLSEREVVLIENAFLAAIEWKKEQHRKLIRKIEIHIETTEECLENFNLDKSATEIVTQDVEFLKSILKEL